MIIENIGITSCEGIFVIKDYSSSSSSHFSICMYIYIYIGRAPALLDNLFQALIMAPLFVLMEVMFYFGYRKDFQKQMHKAVAINIKAFKASKNKGKGK